MTFNLSRAFLILGFSLLFSASSFAQFDSGQIAGFVHDASGSVIAGAKVTATNDGNVEEHHTTTNESGHYIFPNLVVGLYSVSVEAEGFNRFVQKGVKLSSADRLSLDVELKVGSITQSVEIQGSAVQLQTESAQVSRTIESRQIQDLTLNGRNPIFLALLKPGVRGGSIGAFQPDDVTNGGFSINGGRPDEYLVVVDGAIATRTRSSGSMLGAQNVDTVQEVQILTANYSAEYGRSSAGQIRFVTKSGTQHFHGDLVENFRNSWLDANSWLRNHSPRPEESSHPASFRFNQYGYDVGGPIYIPGKFNSNKSKLFFFVAQEWIARREERTTTATVPSLAMRRGNFSELLDPNNRFITRKDPKDPNRKIPVLIKDPQSPFLCFIEGTAEDRRGCFGFNPITNTSTNVIPANRLSANGLALLNAYPQPTPGFQQGTDNWIGTEHAWSDLRKDTIKIDYLASEKQRISFRATYIPWHFNDPLVGLTRMHELWSRPNSTGVLSLTSTISPTLINEFTFSANSDGKGTIFEETTCGAQCRRSTYGINYQFLFPGTKLFPEKLPTMRIDGLSALDAGPYPGTWAGFVYAWANNTTKIVSNHMLKWGVFIERSGQNDVIQLTTATPPTTNNQNGAFRFLDNRDNGTGVGLGNAALGLFNDYSEFGAKPETPWVATAVDLFVQDNWKATKKLTVEVGVRWAYWPPWHSRWGSIAMFDPNFYDPAKAAVIDPKGGFIVSGDPYNGIVLPGNGPPSAEGGRFPDLHNGKFTRLYHGLPEGFSQSHRNVFQPRLGFAYALNSKTALRTGVGAFANRTMINRDTALGGNAPFMPQQTAVNGSADSPGGPGGSQIRSFPFNMTIQDLVLKVPMAWNWNATFQRQLPWAANVEVAYVGRLGLHNQRKRNINQLLPGTCPNNKCPLIPSDPKSRFDPAFLRPFRGMGIIGISENSGRSIYHGMQVSVERRFSSGLQFGVAYTLSRAKDNSSDLTDTLPNAYDDRAYWGISDLDRTHVLILNYIYEIPFLKGSSSILRRLAGNWEISGVNQFQSGGPFSIRSSDDFAGVGPGSGAQFWNQVDSTDITRTSFTSSAVWFNRNAFAQPALGTFGVQERNGLRNPGFWTWDMGIRKNFPVTEAQRLQFRLEIFNLLNHPNWGGANANPKSGSFGQVTSKSDQSRKLQLALKYIF